jgi:drug/metabolite transporter (DMT)-like permease
VSERGGALTGALLLGVAIFMWGTAFRAHAEALPHAPPLVFAAIRVIGAALVLSLIALLARRRLTRRQTLWAALTGVLMVALSLGGVSEAIPRAGADTTAVIFNSYPFLVLALGAWLLRERVAPAGFAGVLIGFAGLITLVLSQSAQEDASDVLLGVAIAGTVAIGWGGGTVMVALLIRSGERVDLLAFAAVQHVVGAVLLVAVAVPGLGSTDWGSAELWAAASWVALGSSVAGTLAFFEALRHMTAGAASTWQFLVPTIAVLVEAATGHAPGALTMLGMGISIAGVFIVSVSQREPEPARAIR